MLFQILKKSILYIHFVCMPNSGQLIMVSGVTIFMATLSSGGLLFKDCKQTVNDGHMGWSSFSFCSEYYNVNTGNNRIL